VLSNEHEEVIASRVDKEVVQVMGDTETLEQLMSIDKFTAVQTRGMKQRELKTPKSLKVISVMAWR